jgi:hypothetical protein
VGKTLVELTTDINKALKTVDEFWKSVPEGQEKDVPREKREEIKGSTTRSRSGSRRRTN